jgi:hypothetical protein
MERGWSQTEEHARRGGSAPLPPAKGPILSDLPPTASPSIPDGSASGERLMTSSGGPAYHTIGRNVAPPPAAGPGPDHVLRGTFLAAHLSDPSLSFFTACSDALIFSEGSRRISPHA